MSDGSFLLIPELALDLEIDDHEAIREFESPLMETSVMEQKYLENRFPI